MILKKIVSCCGLMLGLLLVHSTAIMAADPFRSSVNARPIDTNTGLAFRAMFEQGNYQDAQWYLQQAQQDKSTDPMIYGMLAAFAYQQQDWQGLADHTETILATAKALIDIDPLRGYIYQAVGYFMEGAYTVSTEGLFRGAPKALDRLEAVFQALDQAEAIDAMDPELNLIRGYLELFLAINLPFNHPENAIDQLKNYGQPQYLAHRGIAIAYRDLGKHEQALEFVDKALIETPENPELLYLKAQILTTLGKQNDPSLLAVAQNHFIAALEQPQQLPKRVAAQIFYEQCKNLNRIDQIQRPCDPLRDTIRERDSLWGPVSEQMPSLSVD